MMTPLPTWGPTHVGISPSDGPVQPCPVWKAGRRPSTERPSRIEL